MNVSRNPGPQPQPTTELDAEIDLTSTPHRPDLHDPMAREAVEHQLTRIPGVLAVRVVPGYERDVDELHVVTTPQRGAKATVRDVQTVLLARCGVRIDHRVISVVQLEEQQLVDTPPRVRLLRVGASRAGNRMMAEVTLGRADRRSEGTADGAATTGGHASAMARATLSAFCGLLDTDLGIELRDASLVTVGGHDLAVALLELRDDRGEELRSGTALVATTPDDAVARSVLDALNRTVEPWPR